VDVLERRACELASRATLEPVSAEQRAVSFQLRGRPCAVDASVVERALARLTRPLTVPVADGVDRMVAFIDERPMPVVDLAGMAAGRVRGAAALEGRPAVVVSTGLGPVAVAVDGPLELLEDHLAAGAAPGDPAEIRTVGVLGGGAIALDPAWLQEWAEKAARP
jgi:hypothetical protein